MATLITIHPDNPQPRLIQQAVDVIRSGGLIAYPTDSSYALGCALGNAAGKDRITKLRGLTDKHNFTLVCSDFAQLGTFVHVGTAAFRTIRTATPGSYTFILPATKEVPKRLMQPKRRTVGVRIPEHKVVQELLAALGEPLLSSTLILPGREESFTAAWEIDEEIGDQLDVIIDAGECSTDVTTVIDLSGDELEIIRPGAGDVTRFAAT